MAAGEIGDDDDEPQDDAAAVAPPNAGASEPDPAAAAARPLVGLARLNAMAAASSAAAPDLRLEFRLWPEHLAAFSLWCRVQTQWRTGMAGPTGLDWQGVRAHPASRALPRQQRERILADLACMEVAWLAERARIAQANRSNADPSRFAGLGG